MGGGVVAEFFSDLKNPIRFSGGGGGDSSRNFSLTQIAYAIRWGGGSSAEFRFSVTSTGHFQLMGPFFSILLSRRGGGPGAEFFFSVTSKRHFPLMGPFFGFLLSRRGGPGPLGPPLNRPRAPCRHAFVKVGLQQHDADDEEIDACEVSLL